MFARPSRSLAAVLTTATVALAIGAGPLAGTAAAAPLTGCTVDKIGHVNSGTDTLTVSAGTLALAPTDYVVLDADHPSVSNLVATNAGDPTAYDPGSSIAADFNLAAAAPTTYAVTVYDSDGVLRGTCASTGSGGKYTIVGSRPGLTELTTPNRGKGTSTTGVTITGTNLARSANVEFLTGGTVSNGVVTGGTVDNGVDWAEAESTTTATSMTGTLTVYSAATVGQHILRFTNTDGQTYAIANALNVSNAPTVTSLDWTALAIGASNRTVVVTGTDFQPGLAVEFYTAGTTTTPNTADIVINSTTYNSPTQFTLNVSIPSGATAGRQLDMKVTNPDAGTVTQANAMTINAKPTVTDVQPRGRDAGATGQVLAVTGTGFVATLPQTVFTIDNGVTVTASNVTSATSATITVDIASGAAAAARTITATNADGGVATCTGVIATPKCFTVTAPPTISSVSPPTMARGATGIVTITGTNFNTGTYNAGNVSFGAGITVDSATRVSVTRIDATLTIDSGAAQGSRTVTITNPTTDIAGAGTATKSNAFSVSALAVTSATPNSATNTNDRTITVNGGGFALGTGGEPPTVTLVPTSNIAAAQSPIVATLVGSVTSSSLSATFPLDSVTPGNYDISVVNNTGEAGSCSSCFTIFGGQPSVTSVTPSSRGAGAQNQVLSIVGSNFSSGSTVSFAPASGVTVVGTPTVVDGSHITVTVSIDGGAAPGVANPTVTTAAPDSQSGTCVGGCFTVTAKPSVATISPNARAIGSAPVTVTVTGTGFQTGQTPTLSLGAGVTVSNVAVVNATSITATVAIANNAIPGARDATVTNPDGGSSTTTGAFTVNAAPVIDTVTPASIQRGATGVDITISGSNFNTTDTAVTFSGTGLTITQTTRQSATIVVVRVSADTAAPLGPRDVTVTNGDGGNVSKADAVTVVSNPTVTAVAPSAAAQGQTLDLTITGSGYDATSVVSISGTGVTFGTLTRTSATSLTQRITLAADAPTGARDLTVTNDDGGRGTKTGALTVNPTPTVSSVSPSSGQSRGTAIPVTITGTNFVNGATVSFGAGITTGTVTVNSPTSISVPVTIASGATPGPRTVTVTNSDGGTGSRPAGFTVLSNPTLTSVSPAALAQGATGAAVTISGTNFTPGSGAQAPTVDLGPGVTVANVVATATSITLTATVSLSATTGPHTVRVTNPDTASATNSSIFSIDPKLTISSIAPTQMQQGLSGAITVTGTGFQTGPITAMFSGTGITVTSASASSSTAATVNVSVSPSATLGDRDLTLTNNTNKGTATCPGCFKVVSPRPFVVEIDNLAPESGTTHMVTVTAKQSSATGAPTDTAYAGVPVLSSTDTHFTPGTCSAAVNGVSSCSGVVFGDLGPMVLTALGQGGDSDRGGTVNVIVEAIALQFVNPPSSGAVGQPVSFTLLPVAGVANAVVTAYSRPRTLTTSGGTTTPASGSVLACSSASCGFTVTWATGGSKTLRVSDGHAVSPVITVLMAVNSRVTCLISRSLVIYGDYQTLSGTLSGVDGQPGDQQYVAIWARTAPATSLSLVRNVRTNADGHWSTTFRMPRNTVFQARFGGSDALNASTSATVALIVRSKVSVTSRPTTVVHYKPFTVNGVVGPPVGGLLVSLQFFGPDHAWHTLASGGRLVQTRTASNGTYALAVSKGVGISYRWYRVYVLNSTTNAAGVSGGFLIKAT